jgi:hypothetical protein
VLTDLNDGIPGGGNATRKAIIKRLREMYESLPREVEGMKKDERVDVDLTKKVTLDRYKIQKPKEE